MVVIKECFPSRVDFISDYLSKRRQQLEILQQRKFQISFLPREGEKITPIDPHNEIYPAEVTEDLDHTKIPTPLIVPVTEEPKYVKNFNAFIEQTHQHLNQVLANNQRIDDVHGIVTKIQEPTQPRKPKATESAPELTNDQDSVTQILPKHTGRVTNDFSPRDSVRSKQSEDVEHTPKSQTSINKTLSSRTTSSTSSVKSRNSSKLHSAKSTSTKERNLTTRSEILRTKSIAERRTTTVSSSFTRTSGFQSEKSEKKPIRTTQYSTMKSLTSRTLTLPGSSRSCQSNQSGISSRRGNTVNTARSEAIIMKEKRMAPIPVSVINLQL